MFEKNTVKNSCPIFYAKNIFIWSSLLTNHAFPFAHIIFLNNALICQWSATWPYTWKIMVKLLDRFIWFCHFSLAEVAWRFLIKLLCPEHTCNNYHWSLHNQFNIVQLCPIEMLCKSELSSIYNTWQLFIYLQCILYTCIMCMCIVIIYNGL